jgi:hypothetical protein
LSTEAFTVRRGAVLIFGFALLACPLVVPGARAAEVDFRPVFSFGLFHSGNVLLGYDPVNGQQSAPQSDDLAAVAVDLVVDRIVPGSTFSFRYQPAYAWYRKHSDLDYFGNTISLRYAKEQSRRTSVSVGLDATRTDYQGITASTADRPNTIVPRTTITRVHAAVGGTGAVAKRGLVDWEIHGGLDHYDPVPGVVFNNSSSVGVRTGWRDQLSERATFGLAVIFDRFSYDQSPSTLDGSLVLTGTYKFQRSSELRYDAGATRVTSDGRSSTLPEFLISFDQELTNISRLIVGASQTATPGTGLAGTTRDSGAWVSYESKKEGRGLRGSVDASYWYRTGIEVGNNVTGSTSTFNVAGTLGWTFSRYLSLNGTYAYVYQTTDNGTTDPLYIYYPYYGVSLRWAIRGR